MILLSIESSCDETSASVLNDFLPLSNIISSQLIHKEFGGIIPELASRDQLRKIDIVVEEALKSSGTTIKDIKYIAATQGPGLIGSLLVGYNFARSFAVAKQIPFIPINHIESHIYSSFIGRKEISFPFLSLVVSGGHTILFLVKDYFEHKILGTTLDDAAGEAFDKVAKLLGFAYPGGPVIDKMASEGNENYHRFPVSNIDDNPFDFSFSGVKTSVLYYLKKNSIDPQILIKQKNKLLNDICASFQKAVVDSLVRKTMSAANKFGVKQISISGGVSMNSKLRYEFIKFENEGFKIYFPKYEHTTDNAAMVGYTAYLKINSAKAFESDKSLFSPAFPRFDYDS